MTHILDILNELAATDSRLEKEAILERNKENELFRRVLRLTLDPRHSFYINKTPKERFNDTLMGQYELTESLDFAYHQLATRKISGNAAKTEYATHLGSLSPEDAIVLERVIKRDLRCGVNVSTVNNVFGDDFIYEHPVLLCDKETEKSINSLFANNEYVFCQLKSDGSRATIAVYPDKVVVQSRSGEILKFGNQFDYLSLIPHAVGRVFDGELMVRTKNVNESRQTSNGIVNKVIQGTASEEEMNSLYLTAWDFFPIENFLTKKKTKYPYLLRWADLNHFVSDNNLPNIVLSETQVVKTYAEAKEIINFWMARGEEGGVLKSPKLEWENKRSKDAIKIKAEHTGEFVIVGWEYGEEGKQFQHGLGGLIVETRCGKLRTKIGKGFKENERLTFLGYEDPNDLIGKVVECKYNSAIIAKDGDQHSLFLEKFVKIRFDKNEANSLEELKGVQ